MKAFALIVALLCVGDLAVDRGEGLRAMGHAATVFSHDAASDFHDSLFAG